MSQNELDKNGLSDQLSGTIEAAEELDDAERREMLKRVARIGAAAVPAAAVLLNSTKARAQSTSVPCGFGCAEGESSFKSRPGGRIGDD